MGIGEQHTFSGELIDVRGRDFRFFVVAAGISVPHVIHENEDDVRLGCRRSDRGRAQDEEGEEGKEEKKE